MISGQPRNIQAELESILDRARRDAHCRGIAIARTDGLMIVHRLPRGQDSRVSAAIAASLLGASEVASRELGQGQIEQVMLSCAEGNIIAVRAGDEGVLIAILEKPEPLGLALLALANAARDAAAVLEEL